MVPPSRRSPEDELVCFAHKWIPYGAPPPEEVMVEFGMTPERFWDALRQAIRRPGRDPAARQLRAAYFARE